MTSSALGDGPSDHPPNSTPNGHALVLFSGGKDSTVTAAWAKAHFRKTTLLEYGYDGRPRGEGLAAARIADTLGLRLEHVSLAFLRPVVGFKPEILPEGPIRTAGAYVPMRNLVFHAVALSLAEQWQTTAVVAGHIQSDGAAYPDATRDYLTDVYRLARSGQFDYGQSTTIKLELPLIGLSDPDVIELGRSLAAPLEMSWSCLSDGNEPCSECVSCTDRARVLDPGQRHGQSRLEPNR